jgi:hypothetical protein
MTSNQTFARWLKQFFYSLNMWSMGFDFRRAWKFYESKTGEILRGRKERP